jgi:hypothetical protein
MGPFMGPVMYPPGFYGQYPLPSGPKPGEGSFYPPLYITQVPGHPSHPHGGQEGDSQGYSAPHFYSTPFLTSYPPPYQTYFLHRADGQPSIPSPPYATYAPLYPKPLSAGGTTELVGSTRDHRMDGSGEDRSIEKSG